MRTCVGLCTSRAVKFVDHVNTNQQWREADEIDFRDIAIRPNYTSDN